MSGNEKSAKKDGNSSFLNSLLNNQQQTPLNKSKNGNKNPQKASQSIRNFLSTPNTSTQNKSEQDDSDLLNTTGSTIVDTGDMPELTKMVSVLESRRKALEEKKQKFWRSKMCK